MAISFSCSFAKYNDVDGGLDSYMARSLSFGKEVKTLVRSVSFKHCDSEPTIRKCLGSGKMTIEKSVSFKRKEVASIPSRPNVPLPIDSASLTTGASTTSAQLSPGVEEIRRRSPRQPPMPPAEMQTPATTDTLPCRWRHLAQLALRLRRHPAPLQPLRPQPHLR